jgi:hypothetical protein
MKSNGPFRSAMLPHSRHANTTGTEAPEGKMFAVSLPGAGGWNSAALMSVKTAFAGPEN